jgi:hypothetical protein
MEGGLLKILFSAENVRTLVLLVAIIGCGFWVKTTIIKEIRQEMENGYLSPEDKRHIDGMLDK